MRAKISWLVMILGLVFGSLSVNGQDSPTPSVITADNVSEIAPISTLESTYLGDIVWSNDSKRLAVGTSHDGALIFDVENLATPPITLEGSTDVMFSPSNEQLISSGTAWDITTQQVLFTIGTVDYQQFSPDGRYLMTAKRIMDATDFTLYQMPGGEVVYTFTVDAVQQFQQLVFSADQSRYALIFRIPHQPFTPKYSEQQDNSFIQVRDTAAATILATLEVDYQELEVVFSNNGQYLVAVNSKVSYGAIPSKIIVWETSTLNRVREFEMWDFILSADGSWMFVYNYDDSFLYSLDSTQGYQLGRQFNFQLETGAFSFDGRYFGIRYTQRVHDYTEHGVAIWDTVTETEVLEPPTKHIIEMLADRVTYDYFAFSPASPVFAFANGETTTLWNLETDTIQQTIPDSGQLHFTADGNYLRIQKVYTLGNAHTWEIDIGTMVNESPGSVGYSPDGRYTALLTSDTTVVQDIVSGEETILPILDDYLGRVVKLDGANDLGVFQGDNLYVYDLITGDELLEINPAPQGFTISNDGSILIAWARSATSRTEFSATAYYLRNTELNAVPLEGILTSPQLDSVVVSPDGQYVLATESDYQDAPNHTYLYSLETGTRLASWQQEHTIYNDVSIFSPDSQYILKMADARFADGNSAVIIDMWKVSDLLSGSTGATTLWTVADYIFAFDIDFNLDGSQLVVMTDNAELGDGPALHNYRLTIFDWTGISAGAENLNPTRLQNAYNPTFNPNLQLILTRGISRSIERVSDIPHVSLWDDITGEQIVHLEDFSEPIINPDGTLLAALSQDGQMLIWDIANLLHGSQTPLVSIESPDVQHIAFSSGGERIYQQTDYSVITLAVPSN